MNILAESFYGIVLRNNLTELYHEIILGDNITESYHGIILRDHIHACGILHYKRRVYMWMREKHSQL